MSVSLNNNGNYLKCYGEEFWCNNTVRYIEVASTWVCDFLFRSKRCADIMSTENVK
jgi:hypothetical protein